MATRRSKTLLFPTFFLLGMALGCVGKEELSIEPQRYAEPSSQELRDAGSPTRDKAWQGFESLSAQEQGFIEHFNACANDIANFAPTEEELSNYFYIFKNVKNLRDAHYFLFAESHTDSASQLWNAGAINALISEKDVVLFEGEEAGVPIERVEPTFIMDLFATRQYELYNSQENYHVDSIDAIKDTFMDVYYKTKNFLQLNTLKLHRVSGSYWDLIENEAIHPDMYKRNASMVRAMSNNSPERRVFVIAGALHIPHYVFAHAMKFLSKHKLARYHFLNSSPDASLSMINDAFYSYLLNLPDMGAAHTRVIFDFLKHKKFAVLVPKNLPDAAALQNYFPKNT